MPDPIVPVDQTRPTDAGHTTTEWSITKIAMAIGGALELSVIPLLAVLVDRFPNVAWIAAVLAIAGALLQVAAALGYQRSRAMVKAALAVGSGSTLPGAPNQVPVSGP